MRLTTTTSKVKPMSKFRGTALHYKMLKLQLVCKHVKALYYK